MSRTQRTVSAVVIVMTAIMIIAVSLTTGRTAGAESDVLSSIDEDQTRTFMITTPASAAVHPSVIDRIDQLSGIEWATAFGPVVDAQPFSGGTSIGVRPAWGDVMTGLTKPDFDINSTPAWLSDGAMDAVRFDAAAGGLTTAESGEYAIIGTLSVPSAVASYEPLIVAAPTDTDELITSIVVVADSPGLVNQVSDNVLAVLDAEDTSEIIVSTSESLADLRLILAGTFGEYSRSMVLIVLAITVFITATILSGLIILRRKDYGRRRALGATRGTIITLILCQLGQLAIVGVIAGLVISLGIMKVTDVPSPDGAFLAALLVLAVVTVLIAGLIPAMIAANRDPLTELRVP